jgi:cyclopropane-fatty-acyl-phospholipid synthase
MLQKKVLNKLLASAFNVPVKVTYWDGKTEEYGQGQSDIHVTFNKKLN